MHKFITDKMKYYHKIALLAAAAFAVSCGKDPSDSENDKQRRVLDAYIQKYNETNGTDLQAEESGLFVIENRKGEGRPVEKDKYVYAYYEQMMLDGTYMWVSTPEMAKKLGTFAYTDYYGPSLFDMSDYTMTQGIKEILMLTNQGGYIDAVVPPWLNKVQSGNASSNQTYDINLRYRFKIERVIDDIKQFQIDTMEAYMHKYYNGIDSLSEGFYFVKLHDAGRDTIPAQTEVYYRYIGKLLDGYVFDTNIADSAKKYKIYDNTKDYSSGASIAYMSTYEEMSSSSSSSSSSSGTVSSSTGSSGSVIPGFAKALKKMSYGDEAIAVFYSYLAYGAEGNTSGRAGIPAFQPVVFYIKIDEKDNDM